MLVFGSYIPEICVISIALHYEMEQAPDRLGAQRKAIVFELVPLAETDAESREPAPSSRTGPDLLTMRKQAIEAASSVEPAVKSVLKDPDSAKFGTVHCLDNRRMAGGKVLRTGGTQITFACGSVNSRNGFGGYTGFQHFVVILDPVQGMFIESQGAPFIEMWNKLCAHNNG